ncbi:MAG: DUF2059 domain-containing protein [Planctomycetota bacterium]
MKLSVVLIVCIVLSTTSSALSQDNAVQTATPQTNNGGKTEAKDSHTAAVEEFFLVMKMKETTDKTIDQMMSAQLTQQPQLAAFKDVMLDFLRKHVSYSALKSDMVKLYRDAFTEEEIQQLTAFYRTPVGQKAIAKLPSLATAGAQLGMSRVQANMGELQKAILERQKELEQQPSR